MSAVLVQTVGLMRRRKGPSTVGELYQGGYYAGIINDSSVKYRLLVAPKENSGETSGDLGMSDFVLPGGMFSLTNGLSATNSFNGNSKLLTGWNKVTFVRNNLLGGQNDWYIPARDELSILYRNLKPGTGQNAVGNRPTTSGYGNDGQGYGYNANSDPTIPAYTTTVPTMTSNSLFNSTGTQRFEETGYWTSTAADYSAAANAWIQYFQNGHQSYAQIGGSKYIRFIRRIAV